MTSLPNKKNSFKKTLIRLSLLKIYFCEKRSRKNSSFRAYKRILGSIRSISGKIEKTAPEAKNTIKRHCTERFIKNLVKLLTVENPILSLGKDKSTGDKI